MNRATLTHPAWCAQNHHCTAGRMSAGEHASTPEVWQTDVGRLVATRHRTTAGRDFVELRTVMRLPADETAAAGLARHLIATSYLVLTRVFSLDQKGSRR
jgi:hypothetical protein